MLELFTSWSAALWVYLPISAIFKLFTIIYT